MVGLTTYPLSLKYNMEKIIIVDAIMGRGKSTAAFRHINENMGECKFLYIAPYLEEVDRACSNCEFIQPGDDTTSKLGSLIGYMHKNKNVALTHELFKRFTSDVIVLVKEKGYHLILDETFDTTEQLDVSIQDMEIMTTSNLLDISSVDGRVTWKFGEYSGGLFKEVYDMVTQRVTHYSSKKLFSRFNPNIFKAFESVRIITYLFKGSEFEGYLKSFGIEYEIVGVDNDEKGVKFSDKPDAPPPMDIKSLITIVDNKWNRVGDDKFALSKSWYIKNCTSKSSRGAQALGRGLRAFFVHRKGEDPITAEERMWCTFSDRIEYVSRASNSQGRSRYLSDFVSLNIRATNKYSHCNRLAYLVNRFFNPNIKQFYASLGYKINDDQMALSEMIQWIWRSAIRNGEPITVYIPSSRMRNLLKRWLDKVSTGESLDDLYANDVEIEKYYEECTNEGAEAKEKAQDCAQNTQDNNSQPHHFFDLIEDAVDSIAGTSTYLGSESVRVRYQQEERAKKRAVLIKRNSL